MEWFPRGKSPKTSRARRTWAEWGTRQGYAKRIKNEDDRNIKRRAAAGQDDAK